MNKSLGVVIGFICGMFIYHIFLIDLVIDHRVEKLGLMRYCHAEGGMIPKDDIKWTLYYLKNGRMK